MKTIYKVTNSVNDKVYVGQTKNLKKRIKAHKSDALRYSDLRGSYPMYCDMRKYGADKFKFEKIEDVEDSKANEREEYYIAKLGCVEKGYNISHFSKSPLDPNVHKKLFSEKARKQTSERNRKRNLKKWKNKEYREKMSLFLSDLQKERLKDPEYRAEKSAQLKKHTDSIKKTVYQYDKDWNLIATFNGTREAERQLGFKAASISEVARTEGKGRRKTYKGFHWRYHPVESVETIENKDV